MKILHIFDHSIPLHSGYTFRSKAILEHQRKLGWETDHITSPKHNIAAHPDSEEELINGFHFFRTKPKTGLVSKLPILNQLAIVSALEQRLDEIIPRVKPDIIHAHSPALNGRAAINAANRFGIPVVYEIRAFWEDAAVDHGTTTEGSLRYRITRAMETRVIQDADAVTTICEGLRQDIIKRGIPEFKITVIPNAVDVSKFNPNPKIDYKLQENLGLKNHYVVGFIGSFYAYEGLPMLIEALPLIAREYSDVKLLLVGGGPQEEKVRQIVNEFNLTEKVIFTGRVPHDQVQSYYGLVDIFVYPRLSMRLTDLVTPLKPLEAMAQMRLVVASDVGGHKELIKDGESGVLFKSNDVQDLAKSVINLLKHQEKWEALRLAGRRFVEQERNWAASVERYRNVYLNVLGGHTDKLA
jgi:PEP-CTERM/exosortase A-associated glycosyltransferase